MSILKLLQTHIITIQSIRFDHYITRTKHAKYLLPGTFGNESMHSKRQIHKMLHSQTKFKEEIKYMHKIQ